MLNLVKSKLIQLNFINLSSLNHFQLWNLIIFDNASFFLSYNQIKLN